MDSLIKIDGNLAEPLSKVAIHFIDKVSSATNWIATPKGVKAAQIEATQAIIKEITENKRIDPVTRNALSGNINKITKEYINQTDIMAIAAKYLNEDAKPDKVDDDWIVYFFEQAKLTSDEGLKLMWAKLLAGEFNNPNTYSKQLIHILSLMDSSLADKFQKIRKCCFYVPPHLYAFVYRTDGESIDNITFYNDNKITFICLKELDNLGLIQLQPVRFYTIKNSNKKIMYGDKTIQITTTNNNIYIGNATLTSAGKQLCKLVPMEYDDDILNICISTWERLDYKVKILT